MLYGLEDLRNEFDGMEARSKTETFDQVNQRAFSNGKWLQAVDDVKHKVAGGIPAGTSVPGTTPGRIEGLVPVTRWGRPGLQAGDWVQIGGNGGANYFLSGKWQPAWIPGGNMPAGRGAGQTFVVPRASLGFPLSEGGMLKPLDWLKYGLGQRQYLP